MTNDSLTKRMRDAPEAIRNGNNVIANRKATNDTKLTDNDRALREENKLAVQKLYEGMSEIPNNWDDMTTREQRDWMYLELSRKMPNLPKSLGFLFVGSTTRGDCGRSAAARPDWLDHEKFLRGQRFAMDNFAGVSFSMALSLYGLFSFEDGLKPLILTGKSSDPFTAFKRYLSTGYRVKNWFSTDPWTEGTPAYRDIQVVRRMHDVVRQKLLNSSLEDIDESTKIEKPWSTSRPILLEDFRGSCPVAAVGQRPYAFTKDEQHRRPKGMNQSEMAATQSGFLSFVVLHPEYFGIHGASDDDLDAYCHVWRSVGYLLGMEDEFNFCNGTLDEVKQRSSDFLEYWVKPNLREVTPEWEHMLRCLMTGVTYYFPLANYQRSVLYVAEMLNIPLPRFEASLGYGDWLLYKLMKIIFLWAARLPGVPAAMNRSFLFCMERGRNYTREKLEKLKKHSTDTLSRGIEETRAARKMAATSNDSATSTYFYEKLLSTLSSTLLILLSLLLVAKFFARTFSFIDIGLI